MKNIIHPEVGHFNINTELLGVLRSMEFLIDKNEVLERQKSKYKSVRTVYPKQRA